MAKRSQHSFLKMARRQGKAERSKDGTEKDQAQAGGTEAPVG